MKIIHDKDKCIGCGLCVQADPKLWKMSDEDGKAELIGGKKIKENLFALEVPDSKKKVLEELENICPVSAIKLEKKK